MAFRHREWERVIYPRLNRMYGYNPRTNDPQEALVPWNHKEWAEHRRGQVEWSTRQLRAKLALQEEERRARTLGAPWPAIPMAFNGKYFRTGWLLSAVLSECTIWRVNYPPDIQVLQDLIEGREKLLMERFGADEDWYDSCKAFELAFGHSPYSDATDQARFRVLEKEFLKQKDLRMELGKLIWPSSAEFVFDGWDRVNRYDAVDEKRAGDKGRFPPLLRSWVPSQDYAQRPLAHPHPFDQTHLSRTTPLRPDEIYGAPIEVQEEEARDLLGSMFFERCIDAAGDAAI